MWFSNFNIQFDWPPEHCHLMDFSLKELGAWTLGWTWREVEGDGGRAGNILQAFLQREREPGWSAVSVDLAAEDSCSFLFIHFLILQSISTFFLSSFPEGPRCPACESQLQRDWEPCTAGRQGEGGVCQEPSHPGGQDPGGARKTNVSLTLALLHCMSAWGARMWLNSRTGVCHPVTA